MCVNMFMCQDNQSVSWNNVLQICLPVSVCVCVYMCVYTCLVMMGNDVDNIYFVKPGVFHSSLPILAKRVMSNPN